RICKIESKSKVEVIAKLISWSIFKRDSVSWVGVIDISITLPTKPLHRSRCGFPWMADCLVNRFCRGRLGDFHGDHLHALLTLRLLPSLCCHRRNVGFFSWTVVVSVADLYRTPISSVCNPSCRACR